MRTLAALVFVPFLALGTIACGDDGGSSSDTGGTKTDGGGGGTGDGGGGTGDSSAPPPAALDCNANKCTDFVASSLSLPKDQNQASELGYDYDNDGLPDNALGGILSGLAGVLQGVDLQANLDEVFNQGTTIVMMRVQANDLTNEAKAAAQAFIGKAVDCCPTDKDPTKCAAESKTTCFKGDYEFEVDPAASATKAIFGGAISGGKGTFGPSTLALKLPISTATIDLNLQAARLAATVSATELKDGKITGGITQDDLNNGVIPAIASLVDGLIKDPKTQQSTKDQILNLFDTDKDGTVTVAEVKDNTLIKTFLAGDVDVDGDGKLDLSLGVGFTAVTAKIKTQ